MKCVLLYGSPAGGKTTLARGLVKTMDFQYVSVGEITRNEIRLGTEIGLKLKSYLDKEVQYPEELIALLVSGHIEKLSNTGKDLLLDGYPKYENEVAGFLKIISKMSVDIGGIVIIDVSLEEIMKRVQGRRICPHCLVQYDVKQGEVNVKCQVCKVFLSRREDDEEQFIVKRFNDYKESIKKTVECFKEYGTIVHVINGGGPRENVLRAVMAGLESMPK